MQASPDCSSSSSSSKLAGFSPSARSAAASTRRDEAAARPRAGQGPQPPWIATMRWWRRWKVQASLRGPGRRRRRARDAEGVAGCDRRGCRPPAAATVPYAGGRVRAGAGRTAATGDALSGGAQAGNRAQRGRGPGVGRGGTAAPSCPATACIRPRVTKPARR